MPDQRPPRLIGDDRVIVCELLQFQRESLVRKVAGVHEADARRSPVGSGTTLLWLLKHMANAERLWILERFAGQEVQLPEEAVRPDDTVASATALYRATWPLVDAVVAATASLDELCRAPADTIPINLRWVLMHLLEETARHAGHADIIRELLDGQTGR
ncbi:MAG TPA: DinB family protein [Acidimicrobiales bacterium]